MGNQRSKIKRKHNKNNQQATKRDCHILNNLTIDPRSVCLIFSNLLKWRTSLIQVSWDGGEDDQEGHKVCFNSW